MGAPTGRAGRAFAFGALVLLLGAPSPFSIGMHASAAPDPGASRVQPSTGSGSDFNNDGYADLAVAAEDWSSDGIDPNPGLVVIMYGSAAGLVRATSQTWTAADFAVGDHDELFGDALAAGDFDGDGFDDLAIGSSELPLGDDVRVDGGHVRIVYGSASGLTAARSQRWSQDSPGIRGVAELEDGFGSALVAADFGRGPQADLAIGVSGENGQSGAVAVLYGSITGLSATGNQLWTQSSPGVPGRRQRGRDEELFGARLAASNFAGRPYADLAIGVPGDRIGGVEAAGSVNVLYGSPTGITSTGAQLWSQRTAGIKGRPEPADGFGWSLAAGHFTGRRSADLAVGVPEENGRGAVNIISGASGGLTAKRDQLWSRKTKGLGDRHRLDIELGLVMTTGNFGEDNGTRPCDDLVVTAYDQRGGVNLVEVIYGSTRGLSTRASRSWDLDSPGIQGEMVANGTTFGAALATGDFGTNRPEERWDDLVVGDPSYNSGLFLVINGSRSGLTARGNRLWTAEQFHRPDLMYLGQTLAAGCRAGAAWSAAAHPARVRKRAG
jgi:hypothetical protein